jgi:acyl-CoA thioester hydrolase
MIYSYVHNTELRVRYGETDQMGYCYYGFYAQYFEVGRVEAIRNLGMSYKSLEEGGIMLPVADFSVKYLSPAYYDDLLTIKTHIKEINGARIYFEYELSNQIGKLIAKANTALVFVTKATMRPTQAPLHFLELIQPFEDAQ